MAPLTWPDTPEVQHPLIIVQQHYDDTERFVVCQLWKGHLMAVMGNERGDQFPDYPAALERALALRATYPKLSFEVMTIKGTAPEGKEEW